MNLAFRRTDSCLRIIVLGYIVRGPLGGMAWHHLQYVMGLHELGHDVYFVEDSDETPYCCYDPVRGVTDANPNYGLRFTTDAFARTGLGDRWAYYDAHQQRWHGPAAGHILQICAGADLLLNLSCANPLRPWLTEIPVRALIDTDPVFTQIRNMTDRARYNRSKLHTAYFSFGENIGLSQATVPQDGFPWLPTRQPIVLSAWPVTKGAKNGNFTTVMQWDSYPRREWNGVPYGLKSESFAPYMDLPETAGSTFELALGSSTAPRDALRNKGWRVRDPLETTRDPWIYQRYIQQSKAEFSVAKHGYVISRSGWFSERSAAYMASGRPVLLQDTGFSEWLETGSGVLPFNTPEEALMGVEEINRRYPFHCQAARAIAEKYFDARKVLSQLLERAMGGASTADNDLIMKDFL